MRNKSLYNPSSMKILIVGLGSIGQRHIRVLRKVFKNKITLFTLNTSKNNIVIKDNFKIQKVNSLTKYYNLKKINISEVKKNNIDVAFVCNPTNLHLETASSLVRLNCNVLIEKPLSVSAQLNKIKKLITFAKKKRIVVQVGYQLRFHPGIKIVKNIIKNNTFGEVIDGYFHFGEYLGSVRKWEKFSDSISAKKKFGGGALGACSHHLDLAMFLLGKLKCKYSLLKNSNNFKIDVEDNCKIILTNNKNKNFSFNMNFLDSPQNNFFILNFKKGSLKWNYTKNILLIKRYKKLKIKKIKFNNFHRNDLFEEQTKSFFSKIKTKNYKNRSFLDGFEIVKLINEIRKKNLN